MPFCLFYGGAVAATPSNDPLPQEFPYRANWVYFVLWGIGAAGLTTFMTIEAVTVKRPVRLSFLFGLRLSHTEASVFFGIIAAIGGLVAAFLLWVGYLANRHQERRLVIDEEGITVPPPLLKRKGFQGRIRYSEIASLEMKELGRSNRVACLRLKSGGKAEIVARMLPSPAAWTTVIETLRARSHG